jgi:hypothetical protein
MSGFADRIFGYLAILVQLQVPGTGTVFAPHILILGYPYIMTVLQDICRVFGATTSDIISHNKSSIIGYSRIFNPGYPRGP